MRSTFVIRLAVLLSLSGCSVLLTRGPRTNPDTPVVAGHQQMPPDCTTSMTWPTIDGILAGIFTIAVFTTISDNNRNGDTTNTSQRDSDVAASIILAGAAGVSAFIGHTRVTRCRRATETYTASYYGQQQQQQYAYPQQYPQQPQYQYPQQYPQQYPAQPPPAPVVQPVAPVGPAPPVSQPPGRQPAPVPAPAPAPPVAKQPAPAPAPPLAKQPAPAPKPPAPKAPAPPKTPDPVGTEGDVCAAQSDCGAGLTCTGNVCLKAK
jgi:hypothetical protein